MKPQYDVIIVGGGPAGLSAALILGRCCRKVLLCDAGEPRNAAARKMHGYLSRDGANPLALLQQGRRDLAPYDVEVLDAEVTTARCLSGDDSSPFDVPTSFEVRLEGGQRFTARKLVLATGLKDELPAVPGARRYYGRGVYHCPYCDGWEHRGEPLVAYGKEGHAVGLALSLRTWSSQVTTCTDGSALGEDDRGLLRRNGVAWREEPVARLEGEVALQRVVFESGPPLECRALFFNTRHTQHSDLPAMLGCRLDDVGEVVTQEKQQTGLAGLYLAGDADGDVQFVVVAAAEGAAAAVAVNIELQTEDRHA